MTTTATDLRSRLADKLLEAALHEVEADEEVDAVLAVFAGWLRERADERDAMANRVHSQFSSLAERAWILRHLADEIAPATQDGDH